MSSNLAVEEPMAADPAKNSGGHELREESSSVETTGEIENRGSVETIIEEKSTVVVTETKVEFLGSELGSGGKSTGGLQGDDVLEVSLKKDPSYVDSSVVGGLEEGNDPTEISLHDLTGGLDIDGKPTGGDAEEAVMEASVENEADSVPSSTDVAGETRDGLVDSLSDDQIQAPESRPTGTFPEQPKLKGSIVKEADMVEEMQEEIMAEEASLYPSELSEELEKDRRSVDDDKTRDNSKAQIVVEEIKNVITPVEKVIEACDTVKIMEEGAEDFSVKAVAGQSEEVAEKSIDISSKPDVEGTVVEENEEVMIKMSASCIEPVHVAPPVELSVEEHVQIVGVENVSMEISEQVTEAEQSDDLVSTHMRMDIDGAVNSEPLEIECKEAGGLEAEVGAGKENSELGERSADKEKKPASSLEDACGMAHADGKEAVVYHRREKHHTTKNLTPSPEPQKEETVSGEMHITYNIPYIQKDGFAISDLVWGKVKSHPWWPGVIISPSDGSNLALKYQKRDAFLVAYFGDKTFAWCDESQLKPFFPNFSHFEKQASSDAFSNAVKSVVLEVSRRFEVGTICSCLDEMVFAKEKEIYPKLENAGVRQGFDNCAVDRYELIKYFNPKGLVDFIKDLALLPTKITTDRLELVMVTSQVKAFYRSKGYSIPPRYQTFGPLEDYVEPEIVLYESEKLPEDSIMQVQTPSTADPPVLTPSINAPSELEIVEKPKKKRGRPPKKKKEEVDIEVQKPLSEFMHKKVHSKLANGSRSNPKPEKTTTDEEDSASPLPWKKRKEVVGFNVVEQENQTQTPRSSGFGISFKIGECISRAASRLTGSGSSPLISTPKFDNADFDVSSDEETPVPNTTEEKRVRRRRLKKYHYSDPREMLSQQCLLATSPRKEHGFLGTVVSYFTDFRNFIVDPPPSAEIGQLPEKVKLKRGRKRKVNLPQTPSHEVVTPTDHMQDSYWSDMILCDQTEESSSWPKQRKRRVSIETKHLKLTPGGADAKRALAVAAAATKRSIIRVEEKRLDECNPTALLLSFSSRYARVPSEMDVVRIFSQYGPLKGWEMGKVEGSANRVWIVFKRRADAEMAFSTLRKQNVFGPSLLSYRLVYEVPEKSEQEKKLEVPNEELKSFELLAQKQSVDLPSVSSNANGLNTDEISVDPLNNVEASDAAKGDGVDEITVDPVSNFQKTDAEVLLVNPSSNVEIVDVAQGDDIDMVPVDASTMSIDPSSTVVEEMLIEPLSSTAEISVDSSNNMQIDTTHKVAVNHFNNLQNEAVNENFADPLSTTKAETVTEAVIDHPVFVHVEDFEDVSAIPSSTALDGGAHQLCMNTSSTVQAAAVNEGLGDQSSTMQYGYAVVEPTNQPSTEQDEVTIAKNTSCSMQGEAMALESINQPDAVQHSETAVLESKSMSSQNCGQTDPPGTLHSESVSDISISPANAGQRQVVVEESVEHYSTKERAEVGVVLAATTNTEQGEVLGEVPTKLVNIEEGEVVGDGEIQPDSTDQGKVDGELRVEPARSEQGIEDGEMPESSGIGKHEAVGKLSVETASTGQGKVLGEVLDEVSTIEQGKFSTDLPVSSAEGKVVGEPLVESSNIRQGEVIVEPSSTEQVEDREMRVNPASNKQDSERPVETLSTEKGEVGNEMCLEQEKNIDEVSVEPSKTETR